MIKAFLVGLLAAVHLAAGTPAPLPSHPPIHHVPPAAWTVMPVGDSITLGTASTDGTGYRGPLHALLPTLTFVGSQGTAPIPHEGRSGWRTDQVRDIIPTILATTKPAFILLHVGTNDTVQGYTAATMLTNMGQLLDAIRAASPGTQTFAAQIPITPYATAAQQAQEAAFNAGLPALAAARLPWVSIVDMRATEISPDRVHPSDTGYRKMAELWAAALPEARTS